MLLKLQHVTSYGASVHYLGDSPLQLDFVLQDCVAFLIKYALSVFRLGDFRRVSSSYFHTYLTADCSYETAKKEHTARFHQRLGDTNLSLNAACALAPARK
jgi:hypothetical protein